jgi:hypothetical protein
VHSGADLESAAAAVLGYHQPSVKGKVILVDPVPNVASAEYKDLLQDALLAQRQQVRACPVSCCQFDMRLSSASP